MERTDQEEGTTDGRADPSLRLHSPGETYRRPAASCRHRATPSTSCNAGFGRSLPCGTAQQSSRGHSNRWRDHAASSPRRPDNTIRIFSSDECNLRVARRMSFTTCSAGAFVVTGFAGAVLRFFIIFNSDWGKDEPQILRYAITPNCSDGADGGHPLTSLGTRVPFDPRRVSRGRTARFCRWF
jgi:hypothetical protein